MAPKDEVAQHPRILKDENHQTHGAQSESEYENGYDNRNWKRSILKKLQEWWKDEGVSQTKWTAVTVIIAAAVTAYIRQRQHTPRLTSHNKTEPSMVSSPTKYGSSSSSLLFLLWKTMSPTPRSIVDSSLSLLQMAARQGLVKRALVGSGEILYQSRDSDTWKRSQIPSNSHGIQADLLALLTQGGCEDIAALPDSLASRLAGPILAALPFVYLALVYKIFKNIHNGGNDLKLLSNNVTMTTHFTDVAGLEPIMPEVEEIVHFLRNPHKYRVLGAQPPRGILLQGPPGAGKTLLARAVAGEANTAFCACSGSDFCEMYVGKGAARVRNLFQRARSLALQRSGQSWWSRLWMPPSHLAPPTAIIFIDEFDALAKSRSYGGLNGNDERESTLNQLLTEMDGFATHDGVTIILIAATNRPDVLDPAVLRRFDRQIHVSYPNASGRQDIFKVHAKVTNCNMEEIDWGMLASDDLTTNFSGSDLKNVVNDAALLASFIVYETLLAATLATSASAAHFGGHAAAFAAITPGTKVPSVNMHSGFPPSMVDMAEHCAGRKVAIVPGYLEMQDALKEAGIEEVVVYCVNDGAVMKAWEKDQGTEGSIVSMFGDPSCEFTKAIGMEMTAEGPASVGIIGRCKRFAMVAVDGVVKAVAIAESELDPAGDDFPEKTLAPALVEMAKSA